MSPEQKKLTIQELRTADAVELDFLLREKRKRMFDLRFKAASEEVGDNKEVSRLRRDVARILTIKNERLRAQAPPAAAPSARAASRAPKAPNAPNVNAPNVKEESDAR